MILANYLDNLLQNFSSGEATAWTFFGLAANACFAARFILQWLASERKGRSIVPIGFWYLSLLGGVMMLIYAVHVGKLPIVLGAMFTPFIALRNLWLVRRHRPSTDVPMDA